MSAAAAAAAPASDAASAAAPAVTRAQVQAANHHAASAAANLMRPGLEYFRAALRQGRGPFAPPAAFSFQPPPDAATAAATAKTHAESYFAQVAFPRKLELDAVGELRAKLQLAPRDPAEIAALQEFLSGNPPQHTLCGHGSPSSCYWCAESENEEVPANCLLSTMVHGVNDKRQTHSCITGDVSVEEDRWSWMQASDKSPAALAQYHADRLRLLELFRLKRAALLVDIRLLHGAQWPVAFGCLAGVEPLRESFAAVPPVPATPATLVDLAARADHEEAQMTAAEAGSDAYLRADAYARDQSSQRCIFSEFSTDDADDWRRERVEWEQPCHIPNMTRRAFYLETIRDAGLISDLAGLVLSFVEPPECGLSALAFFVYDERVEPNGRLLPQPQWKPHLRAIPHGRIVAVTIGLRTERGTARLELQPAAHPDLIAAIEANPEAQSHYALSPLNLQFACEFGSPPLTAASAQYLHEVGIEIPSEAGWGAMHDMRVVGRGLRNTVIRLEIFFVRDRQEKRSNVRATPNYYALQPFKPLQEFQENEIERGWRYCTACAQLWRGDGAGGGGVCPASSDSSADSVSRAHTGLSDCATQNLQETLYFLVSRPLGGVQPEGTQADWRRCRACAVLFHGPSAHNSCCPAAASSLGPHSAMDSLEYFVHAGGLCDAPQAAFSEPRWRQCRDCSALVRFKGVCPAQPSRGPHKLSGRIFAPLAIA